jgi:anaerobic selenocysteine-containing dehydrogenase
MRRWAFALLHVLQRDGLVDRAFVAAHTVGWDELEPLLKDCTPAWGEGTTGVSARLIEEAAHLYGEGPSLLWLGQALQRQATGGNVFRACAMLPAVTGNVGKPGAGFIYLHPADAPDRRLHDGDNAVLTNETGRLEVRVLLSDAVPQGVPLSHKGRWPKHQQGEAYVNILNPGQKADMGENTCVHGVEVTVVPAARAADDGRA